MKRTCVCDSTLFFFVLLLEYVPWLAWVGKEIFINLCVFLVSNCSTHVSETTESQTWRKVKRSRLGCFFFRLLGLWSQFRLRFSLYLNYLESTKFRCQYSHAFTIQFMFQGPTLIIDKFLLCPFVANSISEVHGYELFWTCIQKDFFCETGFVYVWQALWF